jgi:hypothetical protein
VPHTSNLKKEKRRRKKLIFNFNFFNLRKKRKKEQKMKSRVVVIELAHKTTTLDFQGCWYVDFCPIPKT